MKYVVYTDGGCIGNPGGIGGYAALIMRGTFPTYLVGFDNDTTNQRMEMKAVILALQSIDQSSTIDLYTDSAYVCRCFTEGWYKKWLANNWVNASDSIIANKDLWKVLLRSVKYHESVTFHLVKGHSDNIFNAKCDELCTNIMHFKQEVDKMMNKLNK